MKIVIKAFYGNGSQLSESDKDDLFGKCCDFEVYDYFDFFGINGFMNLMISRGYDLHLSYEDDNSYLDT